MRQCHASSKSPSGNYLISNIDRDSSPSSSRCALDDWGASLILLVGRPRKRAQQPDDRLHAWTSNRQNEFFLGEQIPRNRMIELTVKAEWCAIKLTINTLNAIELVSRSSGEGALSINQVIKSSCVQNIWYCPSEGSGSKWTRMNSTGRPS